jgi:hypothetical protein
MPASKFGFRGFVNQSEALLAATPGTPVLISGPCRLKLWGGSAATTVTIKRHPVLDNNGQNAPAFNDNHWVNAIAPVAGQDLSGTNDAVIDFAEPMAWVYVQADKVCTYALTGTDPTAS